MLLTIHDSSLRKVAFVDNEKQGTLNYFNDSWHRYLETASSTFDFTVFKKAIISDTGQKRAYNTLNEKAFVSFQYKGRTYLHTIRKVEENEKVIKCHGINLNLELINEYANPYKSPKAMTFKEFCEAMDLLNYTFLKIGVNEISDKKISAEWEGTDTKLNRLLSLAKKFDAEIEFDTRLNDDSSIKSFTVNVYHEHDDNHQGVGRVSSTVLEYGKNLKTISRTIDKTGIYNSVRPTGKDDQGNEIDISSLGEWSVKNAKGELEFYQMGAYLVAPLSMQMYPSTFTHSTGTLDQYTRKDMTVESKNPETIRSIAYRELKKNCYPAVTYEAEGFADLEIGDTVKVYDDGFSPTLLLEMRVSEQTISFTNPKNNKTTFSNAKALENRLSQGIQQQLDRMIEDAKPYTIKLATDNGIAFKNSQGQTIVTPTLMRGNKVINSGWRWTVGGVIKSTSARYIVNASDIDQKMVLTVSAWIDNKEVASEQLTLINTSDGTAGKTQYLHRAWANSEDGRDGFSTSSSANKRYFGTYTDFTEADSQDPTNYNWTALFDNVRVGARNFALGTARATIGNQGKIYTLAQSAQNWPTVQPLYLTFDYVASETIKGFRLNRVIKYRNGSPEQWDFTTDDKALGIQHIDTTSVKSGTYSQPWLWKPYSNGRTSDLIKEIALYLNFEKDSDGTVIISNLRVNTGTVPIDWIPAPEDIEDSLNSKADQVLTQDQLNALNEKAGIIQAELEAKASADTLDNWIKAYKDFVQANDEARAQSEADLISASQRVSNIAKDLGELSDRWNFIDTYMSSSNEGLVIGKNDGSSSMLFSPNGRISMFSAGVEVMYISQGVIHIENGIFSKTVQIGRFREEQYHLNADMNVIRYVGGA
jgi:phage minor structural protein, N-terminal domain protein|nr:MAG TPA: tail protein [Caudoviricetes sp.]